MKLVSLNIWGGKVFAPLMDFVKHSAEDVDIYCFQEVFHSVSGVIESHGGRVNIIDDITKIFQILHGTFLRQRTIGISRGR